MNIIKVNKNKDYTTISNVFLRDDRLSLKSKGVLAMIMSLNDDWDFSISGFSKMTKEGESAIYSAIKELKKYGYCKEDKIRNEEKRIIGNEYTFYEISQSQSVDNHLNGENLNLGFLNQENLNQENQGQLNTDSNTHSNEINNIINKKKKEDIKISSKKKDGILANYDISTIPDGYLTIIETWCKYKQERNQKYKSQTSFNTMVKRLYKLSNGNPKTAGLIVEQSIGNNYAGLFELNKKNDQNLPLGFKLDDDRSEKMKELPKNNW